jgi:hypothetical protein
MKYPWANVAILTLLVAQLVTGYFGFTNGREANRWLLWLHGIGAYALVVLFLWKGALIFDAIRRKRVWTRARLAFIVLLLLLLLTVLAGLLWTFYGPIYLGGFSLVSIHMYLAVLLIPLLAWHSWKMRFIWRVRGTLGRRLFLGTAVATLAGLLLWRTADWSKAQLALPGTRRRFTGSYETGSFTPHFPVVSWIADHPPPVDVNEWQLRIDGAVQQPISLSYEQLREMGTDEQEATLDCTGGWYTAQLWRGVALARLLEMAGLAEGAMSVTVTAVSGYQRRFTLAEANRYLLALEVVGVPLSHGHGFPARLVAFDQRGVNWVKWVTHIHVNMTSKVWQLPLPLQ